MENIYLKCLGSGVSSQKYVQNPLIHRLRNCREISELAGIFLGYQIPNKWYTLGFGTKNKHSDPTITLPLESPPPPGG